VEDAFVSWAIGRSFKPLSSGRGSRARLRPKQMTVLGLSACTLHWSAVADRLNSKRFCCCEKFENF
jgi:hypothetical protein